MYKLSQVRIKSTNEPLPVYVKKANTIFVKKQGNNLKLGFVVSKPKIHVTNIENRLGNLVCEWSYQKYQLKNLEIKNYYLFFDLIKKEVR